MLAMFMLNNLLQVTTSCFYFNLLYIYIYSFSIDDLCCCFLGAVYRIRQYDAADIGSTGSLGLI